MPRLFRSCGPGSWNCVILNVRFSNFILFWCFMVVIWKVFGLLVGSILGVSLMRSLLSRLFC